MPDKPQHVDYEEQRRLVLDLETMILDFKRTAEELDQQIRIEQEASGITDVRHFAYPTFARAAMLRRDNLHASIGELERRLTQARADLSEALEQIKIAEAAAGLEAHRQFRTTPPRKSPRPAPAAAEELKIGQPNSFASEQE